MAISYSAVGPNFTGSGLNPSLAPTVTAGTVNSRHFLFIMWKSLTTEPAVSSGTGTWIKEAVKLNTAGVASSVDNGSTHSALYYADGVAPTANVVAFTGTYGHVQAVIVSTTKASTEYYEMFVSSGEVNINGVPSITTTDTIPIRSLTGGMLIASFADGVNDGTLTGTTLTGTASLNNRVDSPSATGDDGRLFVWTGTPSGTTDVVRTLSLTIDAWTYNATGFVISLTANRINWGAHGAVASGAGTSPSSGTLDEPFSNGIAYRNFLFVSWKPTSQNVEPTIFSSSGEWIRVATSINSFPVASGADTGSMRSVLYYADGTVPSGTQVLWSGLTVGAFQAQIFNVYNATVGETVFSQLNSTGEDGTYGANLSVVSASNLNLEEGDVVLAFSATNTDAGTVSAQTMSSPFRVFGVSTSNTNDGDSIGDDVWQGISAFAVSKEQVGTSGLTTYSHTNASSSQGVTIFLRLRTLPVPDLDVEPNAAFWSDPGYELTLTGLEPYDYFEIIREDETGLPAAHVRGAQLQPVESDTFTTIDYEFRFGSIGYPAARNLLLWTANFYSNGELVYTLESNDNSGLTDWIDSVDSEIPGLLPDAALPKTYLSVPDIPAFNIPVNIGSFQTAAFQGNILSKSHVLGRHNPVVAQDVASGKAGTFTIVVLWNAATSGTTGVPYNVEGYTDFLSTGNVFQMRNVAPILVGFEDFFFVVESYEVTRENRVVDQQAMIDQSRADQFGSLDPGVWPILTIKVNFIETDAPPNGAVISTFTWQTLPDIFSTWQAVNDLFPDWLAVLQTTDGDFS